MQNLIDSFASYLKSSNKSEHTISGYTSDLKRFSKFVDEEIQKPLTELRPVDLQRYANSLSGAETYKARLISSVKSFYTYLYRMEFTDKNLADRLETPKLEKKKPYVIGDRVPKEMLEATLWERKDKARFRDHAILAVFLYTGIRREELTNIKLDDVDMEHREILIHGKGDKERAVFISDALFEILSLYLFRDRSKIAKASESEYLFPSQKSGKMSTGAVNAVVNKALEAVGEKKNGVSAHVLRKRYATTAFRNTGDVATVSKALGHSSPTVTMRYLDINEDALRKLNNSVRY